RVSVLVISLCLLSTSCDGGPGAEPSPQPTSIDPTATDFFFMRNTEIREDLLEQLTFHNIEFWINEDQSIGFFVRDTKEVDRLANEAIGVYLSLQ
ncbi:MAG: hypothetical protein RL120_14850, partial [Gammaproteobacteria bacterium]